VILARSEHYRAAPTAGSRVRSPWRFWIDRRCDFGRLLDG